MLRTLTIILTCFILSSCDESEQKFILGSIELQNKNYLKAQELFKQGLNNDSGNKVKFLYHIATCNYYLKEYEKAKIELRKVLNVDHNYRDGYWLMARINSKQGDYKKSLKNYDSAISINPNSMLFASRASIKINLEQYESAIIDLNRAIELDPNDKYALSNKGYAEIKLGKLDQARIDLNKSKDIDPNNPYIFKHIAYLNIAEDSISKACENLANSKKIGYENFGNEYDKNEVDSLIQIYCLKKSL